MEEKSIGKFIAALRRANGMTQKELAERLNVSDKTVSRWECDDGAPDLSLIPVLAEIFNVSCDELLRGQRRPATERAGETAPTSSAKGERQCQRLLDAGLFRYRSQTFFCAGLTALGLIAAMICNFAFLRAYLGSNPALRRLFFPSSVVPSYCIFWMATWADVIRNRMMSHSGKTEFCSAVVRLACWLYSW